MSILRSLFLTIVVGFVAPKAWAGDSCVLGAKTEIATACANGYSAGEGDRDPYPWDSDKIRDYGIRQILSPARCRGATLLAVDSEHHMAKLRCEGQEHWVNLDYLKCNPRNVHDYPAANPWEDCETCSKIRNAKLFGRAGSLVETLARAHERIANKLLSRAVRRYGEVQATLDQDQRVLDEYFDSKTPAEKNRLYVQSASRLAALARKLEFRFGQGCDQNLAKLPSEDAVRGQRTCRLHQEASRVANEYVKGHTLLGLGGVPLDDFTRPSILQKTTEAARARVWIDPSQSTYDDLISRTVRFYGLSLKEQKAWISSHKLINVREATESAAPNSEAPFELSNGYFFGGYRLKEGAKEVAPYDCSDFISTLIRGERDPKAPTTHTFMNVARYLDREIRKLKPEEKRWAGCFETVNLRAGERPGPADIIVSRPVEGEGHIVMVKSFDPFTGLVTTMEAVGGRRNTVGEFKRPIFEPSCQPIGDVGALRETPVRADIKVLRIKSEPGPGCPFQSGE